MERHVSSEDGVIITVISFRLRFSFLLWSVRLLSLCLVSMLSVSETQ